MRFLLAVTLFAAAAPVFSAATEVPALRIEQSWARATAPAAANASVFLRIGNGGRTDDRLLGAGSDRARAVELHGHSMEGGVARMIGVSDVAVPAGQTVELQPGGLHVMLIGLTRPLREGETFPLTLRFARAGTRVVEVDVRGAGGVAGGHGKSHAGH